MSSTTLPPDLLRRIDTYSRCKSSMPDEAGRGPMNLDLGQRGSYPRMLRSLFNPFDRSAGLFQISSESTLLPLPRGSRRSDRTQRISPLFIPSLYSVLTQLSLYLYQISERILRWSEGPREIGESAVSASESDAFLKRTEGSYE